MKALSCKQARVSLLVFLQLCMVTSVWAEEGKLSLGTNLLLQKQQSSSRQQLKSAGNQNTTVEDDIVGVIINVGEDLNFSDLAALDIEPGTQVGGVVTAQVPLSKLEILSRVKGVQLVSVGHRVKPVLTRVDTSIHADSVLQGWGALERSYTGKNVIVGVIDLGLDMTHPMFYNSDGSCRIIRVWNQNDKTGIKPQGFTYGSDYTPSVIAAKGSTDDGESHGTHVSGIAMGGGGKLGRYKGVAQGADLIFVQLRSRESDVLDGISYIFTIAKQLNRPAVVNLSLGFHYGPHDGTSSFDQGVDKLVGPGYIVVGAAGNEGNEKLHAQHTFSATAGEMRTAIVVDPTENTADMEVWAPADMDFSYAFELWRKKPLAKVGSTSFKTTQSSKGTYYADTTFTIGKSRVGIKYQSYSSAATPYYRGWLEASVTNPVDTGYKVVVALRATVGTVHMWNADGGEFVALGASAGGWVEGDNNVTVGEIGGTGKSVITVGAYNMRNGFCNIKDSCYYFVGETYEAASSFSSQGPTADGRQKPEVIAPGIVYSSVNSSDKSYSPTSKSSFVSAVEPDGKHYYAIMTGTSMATPAVTGSVALMLEANQTLDPGEIRTLLCNHAMLSDAIKQAPTSKRGSGIVNIYQTILHVSNRDSFPITPTVAPRAKETAAFIIAPNPNNGAFKVVTSGAEDLSISIYNLLGTRVYQAKIQPEQEVVLQRLPQGIYFVQATSGAKKGVRRMMVRK
ncbi:MAG: S8 family peptidase [Prevotellaceae bacterium]|jgi:subtilisin family serine protease|nr:S8 family peptidase [Prevotellaceae bacterium]